MTNMTFEEAKNYYESLRNKPSANDSRYDNLKNKYNKMHTLASEAITKKIAELNNDVIVFSNETNKVNIIINGKSVYNAFYFIDSYQYEDVKKKIESTLLSLVGWWIGNNYNNVAFEDVMNVTSKAKEVSEKITEEFVSEYVALKKEYYRTEEIVSRFYDSVSNRKNYYYTGYNLLVNSWKSTEGLTDGTTLFVTTGPTWNRTRTVNGYKDGKNGTLVYFTNNTKTNADNVDWRGSFRYNHPEYSEFSFN